MARLERPSTTSKNPATKFISWKSNDKCFSYYDKEAEKNVQVPLPFKFLFLEHYSTVKGWNDASESRIYSNEVFSIGKEELKVSSYEGGVIAEGLYKDVKAKVNQAGGKYHRSVYVLLEDGSIANLQLKGSAVSNYSTFYQDNNHLLDNQWMEVNTAQDGKKGSIKYSMPVFTVGKNIDAKMDAKATEQAKVLQEYINNYKKGANVKDVEVDAEIVTASELKDREVVITDQDDLPF